MTSLLNVLITFVVCTGLFSGTISSYFTKRSIICVSINDNDESATATRCTECPEVEGVTERYVICAERVTFSLFFIKNPAEYFSSLLSCITKYGKTFDAVQVSQSHSSDVTNVKTWLPIKIQQGHMGRARFPLENQEGEISNQTITMTDDYWSIEDLYYHETCQIPRPDAETIRQFNGLVIGPSAKDIEEKMSLGKMLWSRPVWKDILIGQNKMIIYGYAESYEFCNKTVGGRFFYMPHKASGMTRSLFVDQCPEHGSLSVKDQNNRVLGLRTRFNVMLRSAVTIDTLQFPNPLNDIPLMVHIEKDGFQENYFYSKINCK